MSLKAKTNADGSVTVQLPQEFANQELDFVIVYKQAESKSNEDLNKVVDSFYGCLEDEPILVDSPDCQEIE